LLTIKELQALKGKVWVDEAPEDLSHLEELAWSAGKELASMLEWKLDLHEMLEVTPDAVEAVFAIDDYFQLIKQPRPHPVTLVRLRLERFVEGLADE
jgi:hypothetical protein